MKKLFIIALLSVLGFKCYSQINFVPGYFKNNNDETIRCLLKNMDWKNTPKEFKYKLSENSEVKTVGVDSVKEFGVPSLFKYERHKVDIDRSSKNIYHLSDKWRAEFNEEVLCLKLLVDGKAKLYYYGEGPLLRFFYSVNGSNIKQLVYKLYKTTEKELERNKAYNKEYSFKTKDKYLGYESFKKNESYKQQLLINLKADNISTAEYKRLVYKTKSLTKLFEKYNKDKNPKYKNTLKKKEKSFFNLSLRPGIDISTLSINNSVDNSTRLDFNSQISFRFGLEAEYILPYYKNKWSVFIEPTFNYCKTEKEFTTTTMLTMTNTVNTAVDYKTVSIPIGVRHYFFLNNKSKLFINGAYQVDMNLSSSITSNGNDYNLDITSAGNFLGGLGYNYKNKYSVEMRYSFNKEILGDYAYWNSELNSLSLIFGINIF